ncbi:MAG: hypothetical protein K2Q45_03245 [Nitrosomonas sp.]|nr:hypothetical protein [Nitrosomonas sp.]
MGLVGTTAPAIISIGAVPFSNSTLDFNVQAGIIAGGFVTCILTSMLFFLFVFGTFECCCSCGDLKNTCLGIFCIWFAYKYCACCCKDYKRELENEISVLKKQQDIKAQEQLAEQQELMIFGSKEAK